MMKKKRFGFVFWIVLVIVVVGLSLVKEGVAEAPQGGSCTCVCSAGNPTVCISNDCSYGLPGGSSACTGSNQPHCIQYALESPPPGYGGGDLVQCLGCECAEGSCNNWCVNGCAGTLMVQRHCDGEDCIIDGYYSSYSCCQYYITNYGFIWKDSEYDCATPGREGIQCSGGIE